MLRNEGESIVSRVQRVDRVVVGTTHTNRLHTLDRKQAVSYRHAGADSSILQCGFSCRSTACGARFPGALRPVGSSGRLIASTLDSRFIRQTVRDSYFMMRAILTDRNVEIRRSGFMTTKENCASVDRILSIILSQ